MREGTAASRLTSAIGLALLCASCSEPGGPGEGLLSIDTETSELLVGDQLQLSLIAVGVGASISTATWASSDPDVATVSSAGLVVGVSAGVVEIRATVGESRAGLPVVVRDLGPRFVSVTSGTEHTCALTAEDAAYCWGRNDAGQLGSPSGETCPDGPSSVVDCSTTPVPVSAGLQLERLEAGARHTCGLDASGTAYCWGGNRSGQLGDGTRESRAEPRRVFGEDQFTTLSATWTHTCGITGAGALMCWGSDGWGELGMPGDTSTAPVRVAADLTFRSLATTTGHTCGVSQSGATYCWGLNDRFQLGTERADSTCELTFGPEPCTRSPLEVDGAFSLSRIDADASTTCGLEATGTALCWGANERGQLGDGTLDDRALPVPVDSDQAFEALTVGSTSFACGLTGEGAAYCWGRDAGTFGIGLVRDEVPTPEAAAPELRFTVLSAGGEHVCGVATDGITYCWGRNWQGQLGNARSGLLESETRPVRVVSALTPR